MTKVYHGTNTIYADNKYDVSKNSRYQWGKGMYFSLVLSGTGDAADSYGDYIYSVDVNLKDFFDASSYADALKLATLIGLGDFEASTALYRQKQKTLDWYGILTDRVRDAKGIAFTQKIETYITRAGFDGVYIPFRKWLVIFDPELYPIKRDMVAEGKITKTASVDTSIDTFKQKQDSGDISGYLKMNPYFEKEIKDTFSKWNHMVYRGVRAKNINQISKRRLGIYWTFDPNKVATYWGDTSLPLFVLIAKVSDTDVDWDTTIEQYMHPTYAESEIRLNESARPKLLDIVSYDDFLEMIKKKKIA